RRAATAGSILPDPLRPAAIEHAVRARFQIRIDIIEIGHDVFYRPEGRHDILRGGIDVDAAVHDDFLEVLLAYAFQRLRYVRRIGGAGDVGTREAQARCRIPRPSIVGRLVALPVLDGIGLVPVFFRGVHSGPADPSHYAHAGDRHKVQLPLHA